MVDQSGSAKSALNIIDYNLDIYYIREGEIKNYKYDPGTGMFSGSATSGQWIPDTGVMSFSGEITFVATSGMELWCDISGDPVRIYEYATGATSGAAIPVSVRVTSLSGTEPIQAQVSGTVKVTNLSGTEPISVTDYADISTYIAAGSSGAIVADYYLKKKLTRLENMYVHLTSAPTISSELYLTVTPALGSGVAAYATKHLSENPYITASQNYVYIPDQPLPLQSGDLVTLMYGNPCGSSGLGYTFRIAFRQEQV